MASKQLHLFKDTEIDSIIEYEPTAKIHILRTLFPDGLQR